MKLYVGNLAFSTTEAELKSAFTAFGTVDSVSIITDRDTGRSKGFGFVEMSNNDEANAAMHELNGKQLGERTLTVNEARPREERPARSGGFGGGNRGNRW